MKARHLIPLAIFLAIVVFLAIGLGLDPRALPSPLIGKPVPEFSLAAMGPQDSRLKVAAGPAPTTFSPSSLSGRPWVLNIWASWCAECINEHPVLMQWQREPRLADIPLVGIGYKDKPTAGLEWLQRHGNPFWVVASDENGQAGMNLGVYGVPETLIMDARGVVRYRHVGPLTMQILNNKLVPLLEQLERETKS
ncbi:MAG: DsbE family thiol:disulfide interchange protein [Proteobacteria bacterium]|nr:DsbE family thiol:disulfide interchange protein [Pseudomonadota bacterium]